MLRDEPDPQGKCRSSSSCSSSSMTSLGTTLMHRVRQWKGATEFGRAQLQVVVVLLIAYTGNNWSHSYPRNENHNYTMFWLMNGAVLVAAACTLHHDTNGSARGVQLLSRNQTEEWKGWMQWAFIMVRTQYVYIRCC